MTKEQTRTVQSGWLMLGILGAVLILTILIFILGVTQNNVFPTVLLVIFGIVADIVGLVGFFVVNPNQARVLQLFGKYVGTVRDPGLRWANPFYTKKAISLRVRNFETERSKVNDTDGNPIEIAAVVVWKVVDTAEAVFEVDDYENYVHVQSEAAVRGLGDPVSL